MNAKQSSNTLSKAMKRLITPNKISANIAKSMSSTTIGDYFKPKSATEEILKKIAVAKITGIMDSGIPESEITPTTYVASPVTNSPYTSVSCTTSHTPHIQQPYSMTTTTTSTHTPISTSYGSPHLEQMMPVSHVLSYIDEDGENIAVRESRINDKERNDKMPYVSEIRVFPSPTKSLFNSSETTLQSMLTLDGRKSEKRSRQSSPDVSSNDDHTISSIGSALNSLISRFDTLEEKLDMYPADLQTISTKATENTMKIGENQQQIMKLKQRERMNQNLTRAHYVTISNLPETNKETDKKNAVDILKGCNTNRIDGQPRHMGAYNKTRKRKLLVKLHTVQEKEEAVKNYKLIKDMKINENKPFIRAYVSDEDQYEWDQLEMVAKHLRHFKHWAHIPMVELPPILL